jgi:hypothetical protein
MKTNLKTLVMAFAVAATAFTAVASTASAQSVQGPYWNRHIQNNGTGTVPDGLRDPHNDR